jgi:hypothetical protein
MHLFLFSFSDLKRLREEILGKLEKLRADKEAAASLSFFVANKS